MDLNVIAKFVRLLEGKKIKDFFGLDKAFLNQGKSMSCENKPLKLRKDACFLENKAHKKSHRRGHVNNHFFKEGHICRI